MSIPGVLLYGHFCQITPTVQPLPWQFQRKFLTAIPAGLEISAFSKFYFLCHLRHLLVAVMVILLSKAMFLLFHHVRIATGVLFGFVYLYTSA